MLMCTFCTSLIVFDTLCTQHKMLCSADQLYVNMNLLQVAI